MSQAPKLTIELVPSSVWFSSVYKIYQGKNRLDKWREIKNRLFETEGRKCWICGETDSILEAHEFWSYDDKKHIQTLTAIHHLCNMCHKIKHIGLWRHTEKGKSKLTAEGLTAEDLVHHYCKVNGCSEKKFEKDEENAFKIWRERSNQEWKQDFGKYDPMGD